MDKFIVKTVIWTKKPHSISGSVNNVELFSIFPNPQVLKEKLKGLPQFILASELPFIKKVIPVDSIEMGEKIAEKCLYIVVSRLLAGEEEDS